jgi:hypothetical protein
MVSLKFSGLIISLAFSGLVCLAFSGLVISLALSGLIIIVLHFAA